MKKHLYLFASVLVGFSACQGNHPTNEDDRIMIDRVHVEGGYISGIQTTDAEINIFKGIPYAAAPVNDLRWKAPVPVTTWNGVKKCDAFAASPIQTSPEPFYMWSEEFLIPKEPIDEDCLFLNVWTGAKKTNEKRPVLVWIHGGGFVSGSGSVPIYDGEAMARKGVVFVSINYRLGIFGFLAHPDLTAESPQKASGNYGLMDQIAALKWVQDNISAFGGDPEKITIAGQSAGSASVVYLIASPRAKGLLHQAIAQSGAGLLKRDPDTDAVALISLKQAEQTGLQVTEALHASSIQELRAISANDLLSKVRFHAQPIIDGYVLPENAPKIYAENHENEVRLITGWNEDDGIVLGEFDHADAFKEKIMSQWGDRGQELLNYYPAANDEIARISQLKLQRDIVFGAQNYVLANTMSDQGKEVYVYRFARRIPPGKYQDYGAFHTAEVPYAYDNLAYLDRPFETADHHLAEVMSDYWVHFITNGNPNGDGLPEWSPYKTNTREIMYLGDQQKEVILSDTLSLNFLSRNLMDQ